MSDNTSDTMRQIAEGLDRILNGIVEPKQVGFVLLTYPFGENIEGTGKVNYIGNGKREDVLVALKEVVARWEGRVQTTETQQ